jgi:hypothetical protein
MWSRSYWRVVALLRFERLHAHGHPQNVALFGSQARLRGSLASWPPCKTTSWMSAVNRARGFILVLVVDDEGSSTIARVCRDYETTSSDELADDIRRAARQAGNQLALRAAAVGLLDRAAGARP